MNADTPIISSLNYSMFDAVAVILGGGKGTRLFPLTMVRSKPAVPMGGKYRIIDTPISNCLNSEIFRIFVLTQFNSASLNRHIAQTYQFSLFSRGFVDILAAEQTMENVNWFQGTADAVRQSLKHIMSQDPQHILVLSGDQLYQMDYRVMHAHHLVSGADITVAALPIPPSRASAFGVLKVNETGRILGFREKPRGKAEIGKMSSPGSFMRHFGISGRDKEVLASMGIYLFNPSVLRDLLRDEKMVDFGRDIIPSAIKRLKVFAYPFDDYWEDIGTIKAFFQANLDLAGSHPRFNLFDRQVPIFTLPRFLPASRVENCRISNSIISEGCIISGTSIDESVVGIRSVIGDGTVLSRTLLMGADYYERPRRRHNIRIGIGAECSIHNAIIDKNARLGDRVTIRDHSRSKDFDGQNYYIRDGIVVIPKDTVIPAGTKI
ncbi:MAG TPA: glucose-1-phosphate adenylyltransferase [Acidobacteriota bacterium]|jgi:glucose-1-phosphate adenylyltransferase|nr:glucose-1-phosphate adenylyltransferase [Acidobacteriota bacterium]